MSSVPLYDEKDLLRQITTGDEQAFHVLFNLYRSKIYFFILHIVENEAEAEELVQDVFLRIWVSRHTLNKVEHPDHYLFTVARNRSLDFVRKRIQERKMKSNLPGQYPVTANSTEETIDFNASKQLIDTAVGRLPKQQELVYRLSKEQGLSRQEIARELNLSENTVKNHLAEAIRFIRNYLHQHGDLALLLVIWKAL